VSITAGLSPGAHDPARGGRLGSGSGSGSGRRKLKVTFKPARTIFIKGVPPPECTRAKVTSYFSRFGAITQAHAFAKKSLAIVEYQDAVRVCIARACVEGELGRVGNVVLFVCLFACLGVGLVLFCFVGVLVLR